MIAYDLETTNIAVGTPRPLYITAYAPDIIDLSISIKNAEQLTNILLTYFLTEENLGACFVAWNGNRFDAYMIAACLIRESEYVLLPYLTRSKALRGVRIVHAADQHNKNAKCWEFLDGIAMLGLTGLSLAKFVDNFAPDFPKLIDVIDFEKEEFDPANISHQEYARRDSVALWHAMDSAQKIMMSTFDEPLGVTMGGTCIKIFTANIPEDVVVNSLIPDLSQTLFRYVMRGGFCYCVRRYSGPIWKYDVNQAYADAMRKALLPCGFAVKCSASPTEKNLPFIVRVTATHSTNIIPFYYRTIINGNMKSMFSVSEIEDTWITSIEYKQLRIEGWKIRVIESYVWPGSFSMIEFVDRLERIRSTCDGGPSGPIGTMVKATGCHAYGKTVEQIEPLQFVLAAECPDDCLPWYGDADDANPIEHIYYRLDLDRRPKAHHQPHLGAWITAHVRMQVRRAALLDPEAWLYADTDCVVFSRSVTHLLDIDKTRYGAWKIEEAGTKYQIIAKKVYAKIGDEKIKRSAKGMNVRKLSSSDFTRWYEGTPPVQDQVQVQNFLSVMRGAEMFRAQRRRGTAIKQLTT